MSPPGAIILIGRPGSGKSLLGQHLQRTCTAPGGARFLSIGDQLRSLGLVDQQQVHPTAALREEMRRTARRLLEEAVRELSPVSDVSDAGREGSR